MEVTALHIRLSCSSLASPVITVLLLLAAEVDFSYSQKAEAGFPRVDPNSQQHFQYKTIVVSCEGLEGLTGWIVMKKVKGTVQPCAPTWSTSQGPCTIQTAFLSDTGEYWCEMGGGKKSKTVNITVTAGSVILESPVHPVVEGDPVTLRCRVKPAFPNLTADFFKDRLQMENNSAGNLTFTSVSGSDDGLYKCRISGAESPESWLHVRAADHEDPQALQLSLLLWIGLGVFLFLVTLLLIGLLRCRKRQTPTNARDESTTSTYFQTSPFPQTVSRQATIVVPMDATYAMVTKPMMEQGY